MTLAIWLARLIVGVTFMLSGISKMIDPIGTLTQIEAYLAAWDFSSLFSREMVLIGGCALSMVEFVIGMLVATGSLRRSAPLLATLILSFMLPLTAYVAVANPVADCGCFGDLLHISNWATFGKNVVLMALSVFLMYGNSLVGSLFQPWTQWLQITFAMGYMFIIGILGYHEQPLIDFRPYRVGEPLVDTVGPQMAYVYVNQQGEEREFADDELPDENSGWTFSEVRQIAAPTDKMLSLYSRETGEDVTDQVLGTKPRQLLLLFPEPSAATAAGSFTANELNEYMSEHYGDGSFIGITDAKPKAVDEALDLMMAQYPVYFADPKVIKAVARGDMAVVCLSNGEVSWKRTLSSINLDKLSSKHQDISTIYLTHGVDKFVVLTLLFLCAEVVLALLGAFPAFFRIRRK